jgi:hypothetical protein
VWSRKAFAIAFPIRKKQTLPWRQKIRNYARNYARRYHRARQQGALIVLEDYARRFHIVLPAQTAARKELARRFQLLIDWTSPWDYRSDQQRKSFLALVQQFLTFQCSGM